VIQFWWRSGSRFGSGSPKSEIRILRIGGGLCSLSASSCLFLLCFVISLQLTCCRKKKRKRAAKIKSDDSSSDSSSVVEVKKNKGRKRNCQRIKANSDSSDQEEEDGSDQEVSYCVH